MIRLSRANRSVLSEWWWTIDRWTVVAILALVALGIILTLAASPAVANRLSLNSFHFVYRQAVFLVPAFIVIFGISFFTTRQVRRLAVVVFFGGLLLMVATLLMGPEIKGATRWLPLGRFSLQPSEFVKPAFVVLVAWMFAEGARSKAVPGMSLAFVLYALFIGLLVFQPDFGQATLVTLVFGGLLFMASVQSGSAGRSLPTNWFRTWRAGWTVLWIPHQVILIRLIGLWRQCGLAAFSDGARVRVR